MPFIEYECQCGYRFEQLRNINADDDEIACGNCDRKGTLTRVVVQSFNMPVKGGTGAGRKAHLPR